MKTLTKMKSEIRYWNHYVKLEYNLPCGFLWHIWWSIKYSALHACSDVYWKIYDIREARKLAKFFKSLDK